MSHSSEGCNAESLCDSILYTSLYWSQQPCEVGSMVIPIAIDKGTEVWIATLLQLKVAEPGFELGMSVSRAHALFSSSCCFSFYFHSSESTDMVSNKVMPLLGRKISYTILFCILELYKDMVGGSGLRGPRQSQETRKKQAATLSPKPPALFLQAADSRPKGEGGFYKTTTSLSRHVHHGSQGSVKLCKYSHSTLFELFFLFNWLPGFLNCICQVIWKSDAPICLHPTLC